MYKHISVRRFKLVLLMRENVIKIWMVEIREDDTLSSPTANDEMFNVIKQASLYLFSLLVVVVVGKLGVKDMGKNGQNEKCTYWSYWFPQIND